jgi:hypothetical protein
MLCILPPLTSLLATQRIICLLPTQEQWMSLGELRRSLRGGAVVPFPKDGELAAQVISCGAKGGSEYRGAWVFAALSHFLNSQGVVTQQFCKRQLRLSCCTTEAGVGKLVEQFVAQVVVVREEVMILLQPGAEATEFPIWNDRVRVFVANQERVMPSEAAAAATAAVQMAVHAQAAAAAAAAADPHGRNVRPRVEAAPPPAAWLGTSALMPHLEGGAPASDARLGSSDTLLPVPSYTGTDGTGQMLAQSLDWSWPPMPAEDMAMAEIAFDKQMNVPRGGWLWMGRFMDFLEVVDGVPKSASLHCIAFA